MKPDVRLSWETFSFCLCQEENNAHHPPAYSSVSPDDNIQVSR